MQPEICNGHQGQRSSSSSNVATSRICEDLCWISASGLPRFGSFSGWFLVSCLFPEKGRLAVALSQIFPHWNMFTTRCWGIAHWWHARGEAAFADEGTWDWWLRWHDPKDLGETTPSQHCAGDLSNRKWWKSWSFTFFWRKSTFFTWSLQTLWLNSTLLH